MRTDKSLNIVAVPYWLMTVVRRNNQPLEVFLDFNQLEKIFSIEDLGIMYHLNTSDLCDLINTNTSLSALWRMDFWNDESRITNKNVLSAENEIKLELISATNEQYDSVLKDRLFCVGDTGDFPKPYEIYDVARNTVLLVLYPGHFSGKPIQVNKVTKESQVILSLLREIIQKASVYATFDSIAQTNIFQKYLVLLNAQK